MTDDARHEAIRERLAGDGQCYVCGESQYGAAHLGCTSRHSLNRDIQWLFSQLAAAQAENTTLMDGLEEALDGWTYAAQYKGEYLARKHGDAAAIARLGVLCHPPA